MLAEREGQQVGRLEELKGLGETGAEGEIEFRVREVVEDWFRRLGPSARAELDVATHRNPAFADAHVADCVAR